MLEQQIINGLSQGMLYALMATGLTIIFGVMHIVNFAHGEFYMLGAYITLIASTFLGLPWIIAVALAAGAAFVFGMGTEMTLLRSVRGSHMLNKALLMIGLSFVLQNLALAIAGGKTRDIAFSWEGINISMPVIEATLTLEHVFAIALSLAAFMCLYFGLYKTKMGKSVRATFENEQSAALVGVNINRVHSLTFGIGGMLAGLAGALLGTMFLVNPEMGTQAIVKSFIVVIMGGFGSIPGAIIGGVSLGLIENLGSAYVSGQYKDVFGFIIVIVVLLVRPQGLMGK